MFHSLKIDFDLANSADPDEMPHDAAFHLDLHCLPMNLYLNFRSSMCAFHPRKWFINAGFVTRILCIIITQQGGM